MLYRLKPIILEYGPNVLNNSNVENKPNVWLIYIEVPVPSQENLYVSEWTITNIWTI
jgi:hypothetical protein